MKRTGDLYEKIVEFGNLLLAARKALRGKKDKPSIARFHFNLEWELLEIQHELAVKTFRPRPLRVFTILEPKEREIGASDFRDRVVHHAVCNIIEPVFEKRFIFHSYACRKGKGTHRAVIQARKYCREYDYFLKMDIRKFFKSIDHNVLKGILGGTFRDPDLLWLLDVIIDGPKNGTADRSAGAPLDGSTDAHPDGPVDAHTDTSPDRGIPIGSLTSQNFANLYLDQLDHYIKDELGVKGYLRYMDDFILFGDRKEELHILRSGIVRYLHGNLKLELKERATIIAPVTQGLPFLGFRIFPGVIRVRSENRKRTLRKMKHRIMEFRSEKITEDEYSSSLMSMTEHLKIGNTFRLRRDIFDGMFPQGRGR